MESSNGAAMGPDAVPVIETGGECYEEKREIAPYPPLKTGFHSLAGLELVM